MMSDLEGSVVGWFAARSGASNPALRQQLAQASVSEREYTSGAGVFLSLSYAAGLSPQPCSQASYLDGPEIQSPEMSSGALATLHFINGVASSIEIWSYAGDYPIDRHPKEFTLVEPQVNTVNLRREP
jgi:hypothetical protein